MTGNIFSEKKDLRGPKWPFRCLDLWPFLKCCALLCTVEVQFACLFGNHILVDLIFIWECGWQQLKKTVRKHFLLFARIELSCYQSCQQKNAQILMQNNTELVEILRKLSATNGTKLFTEHWAVLMDLPIDYVFFLSFHIHLIQMVKYPWAVREMLRLLLVVQIRLILWYSEAARWNYHRSD